MFDGRHCKNKDLDLLIKETNKVKTYPSKENIDVFLKLINRFDKDIADNLSIKLKNVLNEDKIRQIIDSNINELIQSVVVDINEHQ